MYWSLFLGSVLPSFYLISPLIHSCNRGKSEKASYQIKIRMTYKPNFYLQFCRVHSASPPVVVSLPLSVLIPIQPGLRQFFQGIISL